LKFCTAEIDFCEAHQVIESGVKVVKQRREYQGAKGKSLKATQCHRKKGGNKEKLSNPAFGSFQSPDHILDGK
jgi:hypothetical protein